MLSIPVDWRRLPSAVQSVSEKVMSDGAPGDSELVRAALDGDESAFAELIRRHKGRVFGTCSRFARNAHQLDDLCQEVFVRAWRRLSGYRGEAPFEHWLARLTVTSCYDFLRRERRHRDQVPLDECPCELRDCGADAIIAAGGARELVEWGMRRLSPDERLILTLLELEERSVREIAAHTGWSESNVKVRAFRARARLREILENSHES